MRDDDEASKFFHNQAWNISKVDKETVTKQYVDDQLNIVHETFSKFGQRLDDRFADHSNSISEIRNDVSGLIINVYSHKHSTVDNFEDIGEIVNTLNNSLIKVKRFVFLTGTLLMIMIGAVFLTGCTGGSTRFIHTSKFPITVIDINTKTICKPVVTTFEGNKYSVSFGNPCHIELVYEQ